MLAGALRGRHVGLVLVTIVMVSLIPLSLTCGQMKEDAKCFTKMAERARDKVDELREIMKNEGLEIPDATMKRYDEGVGNFTAAEAELEKPEPDLSLAVELAKKAMEAFKEVYEQLYTLLEEAGVDTKRGEEAQGLFVAIDRANETIARIEDVVEDVVEKMPSDTDVETFIEWVNFNLTEARDDLSEAVIALELEPPNVGWAEGNVTEARENIAKAYAALRLIGGWTSFWRTDSFLMGIKKSVDRTKELLEGAENEGFDVSDLWEKLEDVEALIDEAGLRREEKDIRGAVERLKDVRGRLKDIHQELAKTRKGEPKKGGPKKDGPKKGGPKKSGHKRG